MFFPTLAALITSVGVVGLVVSSLAHSSDFVFNAAAVCPVVGPLIFFFYVVIGLCVEFITTNRKLETRITIFASEPAPLLSQVKVIPFENWIPEGLRRERKGPLNRSTGRGGATHLSA